MDSEKYSQNIETDSYDKELFSDLESESEELRKLIERGSNLLPNFRSFILDLFSGFFKYNIVFHSEEDVKKSALFGRNLLKRVHSDDRFAELKDETALEGFKSAVATIDLGEEVIRWIKSEKGPTRNSLLREWKMDEAEKRYQELTDEMETWKEVEESGELDESLNESFEEAKKKTQFELRKQEGEFSDLEEEQEESHGDLDMDMQVFMKSALNQTSERIEEVEQELLEWGASMGTPQKKSIGQKLDLAAKLFKNKKLRRLSRMVGALKEEMHSARRKVWSKRGSEVYDIAVGSDLGRVIPTELSYLKHESLRVDFQKRLIEGRLLQYYLKEEKGRGPLVVCLDGSSSMQGDKEIWSKAVCLTLLEIAKKERRKFHVIVFSSGGAPLRVFESRGKRGWEMKEEDIFELADYFPGGGTDFESPLDKALSFLQDSKFTKGDVVFITDGESQVRSDWLQSFNQEKEKLRFKVYSVLIDLSERESPESLKGFSDKITAISKLTSEDARDLFLSLD